MIKDAEINLRNLISKYGRIIIGDIKARAITFIGKQIRHA